jgi:hypothetical protein
MIFKNQLFSVILVILKGAIFYVMAGLLLAFIEEQIYTPHPHSLGLAYAFYPIGLGAFGACLGLSLGIALRKESDHKKANKLLLLVLLAIVLTIIILRTLSYLF